MYLSETYLLYMDHYDACVRLVVLLLMNILRIDVRIVLLTC